jgi:phosphoglycolate/pyridoxal phosphate phosphatase family enzyme
MIKAVIFDLDGTLYIDDTAIEGAPETLERLRSSGIKVLFFTNAGTKSRADRAEVLNRIGLKASKDEVYCTSYFVARYLKEKHEGKKAFVVGERGIFDEMEEFGVKHTEEDADVVIVGLDRQFSYEKLAKASGEVQKGAVLIASNKDATFPSEKGLLPGAGSVVAAVEKASGKEAYEIGKPNCYALEIIKKDTGLSNEEIMMVGDRLETDIAFANRCGIKSALVLSGVSKRSDIKEIEPDYIFESIADFSLPSDP